MVFIRRYDENFSGMCELQYTGTGEVSIGHVCEADEGLREDLLKEDEILSAKLSLMYGCTVLCHSGFISYIQTDSRLTVDLSGLRGISKDFSSSGDAWDDIVFALNDDNAISIVKQSIAWGNTTYMFDISNIHAVDVCLDLYKLSTGFVSFAYYDTTEGRVEFCYDVVNSLPTRYNEYDSIVEGLAAYFRAECLNASTIYVDLDKFNNWFASGAKFSLDGVSDLDFVCMHESYVFIRKYLLLGGRNKEICDMITEFIENLRTGKYRVL